MAKERDENSESHGGLVGLNVSLWMGSFVTISCLAQTTSGETRIGHNGLKNVLFLILLLPFF